MKLKEVNLVEGEPIRLKTPIGEFEICFLERTPEEAENVIRLNGLDGNIKIVPRANGLYLENALFGVGDWV